MTSQHGHAEPAVAFLGYLAARERVLADASLSLADNRMQHGYVRALRGVLSDVAIFSSVPAHPDQGARATTADADNETVRHLGTPRLRLLRPLVKLLELYRELASWARSHPGRPKVLVHYNTFLLYSMVGWLLRRRYDVAVVPIAITMPYRTPDVRPTLSMRVQGFLSALLLRRVDGLVTISPFLGDVLSPGVPACVIRGAVPDDVVADAAPSARRSAGPFRIVYAGNLSARYNLAAAIAMMDLLPADDFELHLYGRGALENALRAAADRTTSVQVHGAIDELAVAPILRSADLILALLSTDDELARYSFPSKLFESLASGTPVLATALPTLDPEMAEHLFITESLDPGDLASAVRAVAAHTPHQREQAAAAALEYLRKQGTWSAVGARLRPYLTHVKDWQR